MLRDKKEAFLALRDGILTGLLIFLTGFFCIAKVGESAIASTQDTGLEMVAVTARVLATRIRAEIENGRVIPAIKELWEKSQEEQPEIIRILILSEMGGVPIILFNPTNLAMWEEKTPRPKIQPRHLSIWTEAIRGEKPITSWELQPEEIIALAPIGSGMSLEVATEKKLLLSKIRETERMLAIGQFWSWLLAIVVGAGVFLAQLKRYRGEKKERKTQNENRYLSVVAEKTINGVVICDNDGKIIWSNSGFEKLSGWSKEEAKGKTPKELLHGEKTNEETSKSIREALDKRENWVGEVLNYTKENAAFWAKIDIQPLKEVDGTPKGWLGIQTDISDQKEKEQIEIDSREQAEKENKAKTKFVAAMSHEIRTPLNGMLGYCHLLEATTPEGEQREFLGNIQYCAESLLNIVNEILDFSKIEAGKMESNPTPTNLMEVVATAVRTHQGSAEKKGLWLKWRWENGQPENLWIKTDEKLVNQILGNLISNAIKFTQIGLIEITCSQENGIARFRIEDTGCGVQGKDRSRIFEPFSQADQSPTKQHGGTGLGLAISRGLAETLGGDLVLEPMSEKGGASFLLTIPATPSEEIAKKEEQQEAGRPLHILLAEDNAVSAKMMGLVFKRLGHTCIWVKNGREAYERALAEKFDVILMDLHMPEVSGISATIEIRKAGIDCAIIALTADAQKESQDSCLEVGMNGFITKPINMKQLQKILKEKTS